MIMDLPELTTPFRIPEAEGTRGLDAMAATYRAVDRALDVVFALSLVPFRSTARDARA